MTTYEVLDKARKVKERVCDPRHDQKEQEVESHSSRGEIKVNNLVEDVGDWLPWNQ